LASQLQEESDVRTAEISTKSIEAARQHTEAMVALQKESDALRRQCQHSEMAFEQEKSARAATTQALQQETIARHTLEQQVAGLKERLAENEAHRQSLEEKHQHAREALEHYRQSVKEQRDQDQRRHEQQIQQLQAEMRQLQQSLIVKQEDVTRLNQEGARLVADLSHAQKALYDQQSQSRQLQQKIEVLQSVEQRCKTLEVQLNEKDAVAKDLKSQAVDTSKQAAEFSKQVHRLELELTAACSKLEAQQTMTTELRAYMDRQEAPREKVPNQTCV
jgi:DNA repair exonuclease SbcCD ATPase subunit